MPLQNTNFSPVFYTVCYRRYDGSAQNDEVLSGVRRSFLTAHKGSADKVHICMAGTDISIRYRINRSKFFWLKTGGKIVLQKAYRQKYGYYILTRNLSGEIVSKARYGKDHRWLQTAYYSDCTSRPAALLKPKQGEDRLILLQLQAETGRYTRTELIPCANCAKSAQQSLINAIAGEPQIFAETDRGSFCYCSACETERRMAVMKDLNSGKESLIPEWPCEKDETVNHFIYIENDHPVPEPVPQPEPEEPAVQPDPEPDYAADHEIFSTEEPPTEPPRYTVAAKGINGEAKISDCLPLHVERGAKRIVISAEESYTYFGKVINGLRQGRGRTQMQNGCTAYDGSYLDDKRDGFGAYYYKSGKICYVGDWKANKRDGLGVAYSSRDGSIFVGRWKDNIPTGSGAAFDADGNLIYTGEWKNGLRHGHGTEYKNGEIVFVGEFREDRYYSGYKHI